MVISLGHPVSRLGRYRGAARVENLAVLTAKILKAGKSLPEYLDYKRRQKVKLGTRGGNRIRVHRVGEWEIGDSDPRRNCNE